MSNINMKQMTNVAHNIRMGRFSICKDVKKLITMKTKSPDVVFHADEAANRNNSKNWEM